MKYLLATSLCLATISVAMAQQPMNHGHMSGGAGDAYMQSMKKMSDDMGKPMSGDADKDFATMMIPHHQGAIEMAKTELQFGKDPALRKMATAIIKAQEKEIATLKAWLAKAK